MCFLEKDVSKGWIVTRCGKTSNGNAFDYNPIVRTIDRLFDV